jgi:hypothetical protein
MNVDAAELLCGPSGTWAPRKGYTPILELDSQALTGLLVATVYHYRVHSTNAWGAQGVSADFTLTTRKPRH